MEEIQKTKANIDVDVTKLGMTIIKIVTVGAVLGGVVYFGSKWWKNYKKTQSEKEVGGDVSKQQALLVKNSLNPSGFEILKSADGTDTKALLDLASNIKDIDKVSTAYKEMYATSMYDDLKAELNPDDYQKFLNIINVNNNVSISVTDVPKEGLYIIAKTQEVNIRTSPEKIDKTAYVFGSSNILSTQKYGEWLGYTTGQDVADVNNDVIFTGIKVRLKNGTEKNAFVSKGNCYILTTAEVSKQFPAVKRVVFNNF